MVTMSSTIKNLADLTLTPLRRDALALAEAGYEAIDTSKLIHRVVHLVGANLCVGTETCSLDAGGVAPEQIFFVGVGKCASVAAVAMEEVLGDRLTGGIILDVSVSETCRAKLKKIECFVGTHPLPSEQNVAATKRILELLHGLTERGAVIMLVSGGGSTLLCQPQGAMVCTDERTLFKELTSRGADIRELNTVRKHLSIARGGGLARAAYPASVIGLVISDVPGNEIPFIASGPTVRDDTTVADARAVLEKYGVKDEVILASLLETPKEDKYFERVRTVMLASNMTALSAMKAEAEKLGYTATIVTDRLGGEARDVAKDIAEALHTAPPRSVLLYGGETVVTALAGETLTGQGGRNQELAIAALQYVREGEIIFPISSDGHDNGPLAGAIADQETLHAVQTQNLSIETALHTHNSNAFFAELPNHKLLTGETGTNVSDLILAMKG